MSFGRSVVRVVWVVRVVRVVPVVPVVRVVRSSVYYDVSSAPKTWSERKIALNTIIVMVCGMRYTVFGMEYATTTATATATTTITSTSLHCIVGTVHGTMVTNQGKGNNARHYVAAVIQLSERR
jgi:hypothetical protein